MQLRFSLRAEFDFEEISDYIAADNPTRAVTFVQEIREYCRRLMRFPEAAPLRPEFGEGVRLGIFRSYLILYSLHGDILEIRRVVHGARNRLNIN